MTSRTQRVTESNGCNLIVFLSVIDRFVAVIRYARSEASSTNHEYPGGFALHQEDQMSGTADERLEFHNPPELAPPPGYSNVVAVRHGSPVFIAGQVATDAKPKFLLLRA
jgi:hypothetical protein